MTTWLEVQQDVWDALPVSEQFAYAGNTDPWAGPVDPVAHARWQTRHRADVTHWRAQREQPACGCWQSDCGECMPRVSNGERPSRGQRHRFVMDMSVNRVQVLGLLQPRCACPPCPGRGYDGHGMNHCAECCFGTGVEADMDCPTHGVNGTLHKVSA